MTYQPIHQENPVYGLMGRKITHTGEDSSERQLRQAFNLGRTIDAGNDLRYLIMERGT